MNRATSATGWVRNPVMKSPELDPTQASSYELGWTFNPITGCLNHVDGLCEGGGFPCYACKLANGRLKQRYLANTNTAYMSKFPDIGYSKLINPFYPRFWENRLKEIDRRSYFSKPQGIFVCDMGDLFGIGVPEEWTRRILGVIDEQLMRPQKDRFYLLTKQPQNLIKFSPFPENCWVGVTATNAKMFRNAMFYLGNIEASIKYISFEPLLSSANAPDQNGDPPELDYNFSLNIINWLIIGACTGRSPELLKLQQHYPSITLMPYGHQWTAQPPIEWVQEIVEAADKAGVKVFLKDNLLPLFRRGDIWAIPEWAGFNDWTKQDIGTTLRQEMPE